MRHSLLHRGEELDDRRDVLVQQRRRIAAPTLIVGHTADPIHPFADSRMLASELGNAEFVRARTVLEWRFRPERLTALAVDFALRCWDVPARGRRTAT